MAEQGAVGTGAWVRLRCAGHGSPPPSAGRAARRAPCRRRGRRGDSPPRPGQRAVRRPRQGAPRRVLGEPSRPPGRGAVSVQQRLCGRRDGGVRGRGQRPFVVEPADEERLHGRRIGGEPSGDGVEQRGPGSCRGNPARQAAQQVQARGLRRSRGRPEGGRTPRRGRALRRSAPRCRRRAAAAPPCTAWRRARRVSTSASSRAAHQGAGRRPVHVHQLFESAQVGGCRTGGRGNPAGPRPRAMRWRGTGGCGCGGRAGCRGGGRGAQGASSRSRCVPWIDAATSSWAKAR